MKRTMLSTIDNPHSPFDEFDAWYAYDMGCGYHTTELLGRLVHLSDALPEAEYNAFIEEAIDEFIAVDFTNFYVKVEKEFND